MSRRAVPAIATTALIAVLLSGCGGDEPAASSTPGGTLTSAAATGWSPTPTTPAEAMTAKAVVDALRAAGLPVTAIAEQNEDTDPNDKLGRPGGYTSRASADVPEGDKSAEKYTIDRGLVVEVFATAEDADARADFIQQSLKDIQLLGTEYHYRPADKRVLVRLTGKVKPSQAKKFETAVAALA